jgi:hypothetical protein
MGDWRWQYGPAPCPECGNSFPTIGAMVGHLQRVHRVFDNRRISEIAWKLRLELSSGSVRLPIANGR